MADHSLGGYLQRRTTEELEGILEYCLREENYANYEYAILEILDVLKDRFVPETTSEAAICLRERLLRNKPNDGFSL